MADAPTTEEVMEAFARTVHDVGNARRNDDACAEQFALGEQSAIEGVALPIAEHRDALAAEVARLREALEKRYSAGHNDTCAAMLGDYACSCGHDGLLEAAAKGAGR